MRIAIVGGGAAGCFVAVNIKKMAPAAEVKVFESKAKLLAKVAVTGGGRCNLTNSFEGVKSLETVYPRGFRLMKRLLKEFDNRDAFAWFEAEGVRLMTQDDGCVFPVSQDAMEIVRTLEALLHRHGVEVATKRRITAIESFGSTYRLTAVAPGGEEQSDFDCVVVTVGGKPTVDGMDFMGALGIEFVQPVPSLFSFCIGDESLRKLMGIVVEEATVSIPGTKYRASGPLLLTHWGMSGPAVLKLSSLAARYLSERQYQAKLAVNWTGGLSESDVLEMVQGVRDSNPEKLVANARPEIFNARLWQLLLSRSGVGEAARWKELGKKNLNKLVALLTNDVYDIMGKNRYKDEFVTCGGVALSNVNSSTLECKTHEDLYFAGEILDVDAITGGFNLQAAWTMAHVVAKAIAAKSKN